MTMRVAMTTASHDDTTLCTTDGRRRRGVTDLPVAFDPDPLVAAAIPTAFRPVVTGALALPVTIDPHPLATAPIPASLDPKEARA